MRGCCTREKESSIVCEEANAKEKERTGDETVSRANHWPFIGLVRCAMLLGERADRRYDRSSLIPVSVQERREIKISDNRGRAETRSRDSLDLHGTGLLESRMHLEGRFQDMRLVCGTLLEAFEEGSFVANVQIKGVSH